MNGNRLVATTPTVYGIETADYPDIFVVFGAAVATTPTVYGIETLSVPPLATMV